MNLFKAALAGIGSFWAVALPAVSVQRAVSFWSDGLTAFEEEHETLPESVPTTTSAGEKTYPADCDGCDGAARCHCPLIRWELQAVRLLIAERFEDDVRYTAAYPQSPPAFGAVEAGGPEGPPQAPPPSGSPPRNFWPDDISGL